VKVDFTGVTVHSYIINMVPLVPDAELQQVACC